MMGKNPLPVKIISAPSALGLSAAGVAGLAAKLLSCGLREKLGSTLPIINVPTLNDFRSSHRDPSTQCINASPILMFSKSLNGAVSSVIRNKHFACVLGGDCSVLLGIMPALKQLGPYGLVFLDAHADFYGPGTSTTGEVADMDLALVTGRGPEPLTNIGGLKPYVDDRNVIHIGQRDEAQTEEFQSEDIRRTGIKCHSLDNIRTIGIEAVTKEALDYILAMEMEGFWIHFDTDVLADEINPAVDYRLPGGLQFEEISFLLKNLLNTGRAAGMSITIYNPDLDPDGRIAENITNCISKSFSG